MNRRFALLAVAATAGAALAGAAGAVAADSPAAASGIGLGQQGTAAARCIPALGFAAGTVAATDTDSIVIAVTRTGPLGTALVGSELEVDVKARTRIFKSGARVTLDDVAVDDRVAVRILKCRNQKLAADGMKAAIITDYGVGATADTQLLAEAAADSQPEATLLAALGRPSYLDLAGRQQPGGRGLGIDQLGTDGRIGGPGAGASQLGLGDDDDDDDDGFDAFGSQSRRGGGQQGFGGRHGRGRG